MSGVNKDSFYKPDEALHELIIQEQLVNNAVDIQALLRLMVDKNIITREEVSAYREEVRNSPKYSETIKKIESQKALFENAKKDPNGYLKALFKAKADGKL